MERPERPLPGRLRDEIGSFHADLRQMVALRWELARLEVEAAAGQIKRLAIALLIVGVVAVSGLPVLVVAAAAALAGPEGKGIPFVGWLLIFGLGLLVGGTSGGWLVWRRFRRRFTGIELSLEELREDGVWLRQWLGGEGDGEEP